MMVSKWKLLSTTTKHQTIKSTRWKELRNIEPLEINMEPSKSPNWKRTSFEPNLHDFGVKKTVDFQGKECLGIGKNHGWLQAFNSTIDGNASKGSQVGTFRWKFVQQKAP